MTRPSGLFCRVAGLDYKESSSSPEWALLRLSRTAPVPPVGVIAVGRNSSGDWAKVSWGVVDRRFRVETTAVWNGGEVFVHGVHGDQAAVVTYDRVLAESHGFEGSQHDLWSAMVPLSELEGLTEAEHEVPPLGSQGGG